MDTFAPRIRIKRGPLAFSEILDLLRLVLEHIEWAAGGSSLTFVLAQRESHWCLATQMCLLLFYSSTLLLLNPPIFYSSTLLLLYSSTLLLFCSCTLLLFYSS